MMNLPVYGNSLIRETECKSVLNKSGLADYAVNCYGGCGHGCVYCYARFATRYSHPGEPWGSFVDVRVNAPVVLARELKRKKPGQVFMSSVCDAWQPAEEHYGLSRQCLEMLLRCRFAVSILTKSALAMRDLDIMSLPGAYISLGVTMTTFDEGLRRVIEPGSSPTAERLELLQEAARKGIRTYAFLGPLLPRLSDTEENIDALLRAVKEVGVEHFYVDRLNRRFGVWQALRGTFREYAPELIEVYRRLFFDEAASHEYYWRLGAAVRRLAAGLGLQDKMRLCF
jgi:DNA repair photolyase